MTSCRDKSPSIKILKSGRGKLIALKNRISWYGHKIPSNFKIKPSNEIKYIPC